MEEPKGWKSWMSQKKLLNQGVVKRDWIATGRIDFATRLNGDTADADQPSQFKLLVEERRIVESIGVVLDSLVGQGLLHLDSDHGLVCEARNGLGIMV